ncbi:MAG: efflux RND transporter permease subunit [Candidatus Marinarcus sp.]|uniref:efflux RND transporter permease subunit n=1 Tax=Candidatus Marinarcus sp. TaxID=3100987 RepID=UPI003B006D8D
MIKYIIEFSLRKPILNHFLLLFLFILSVLAYFKIPKEIFPPSTLDAITINGTYAGASSDILDKMAVENIEDDLLGLSEADKISTIIKNGFFSIQIDLKDGFKANDVLDDVKDIVTKAKSDLPTDMDEPTVKVVKHSFPLVTVAIYGQKSKEELLDLANKLKTQFMKFQDLSNITVFSDSDKELLITFDDNKIDAYDLDKTAVINAVKSISSIFPVGIIKDSTKHYYLSTFNGEKNLQKIKDTIIKIGTTKLYLKDIANITYSLGDVTTISHFNGEPNISIGINKSETGDAIELVKEIKLLLKAQEKIYPDLKFDTYTDTSIWIKNRLNTVVSNILFGLILLFLALFYFINSRIAFVIAIGIPTSFMIGLIFAESLGYSLNMLSLLGALIALGMLVDEAIVVAENIYRHMEMGKDRKTAAIDGALEVYPAVLTATATTVFAFLPILLMSGEVGRFMKVLPIMITILLLSSLLEAFFFLPLHAKEVFKINKQQKRSESIWIANKKIYDTVLSFILHYKYKSLLVMIALIITLSALFLKNSKFQFMPDFDTTQVYITGSVGVGNRIEQTESKVYEIEKLLLKNSDFKNDVSSISSVIGMKLDGKNLPQNEEFYFHIFVNLYERAPQNIFDKYINPYLSPKYDATNMIRQKSAQTIEHEMKELLKELSESKTFDELKVFTPKAGIVKNDIEIAVSGENKQVSDAVFKLKKRLTQIQGVSNVADDSLEGNVELKFRVNQYGQNLGLNEEYIISVLRPYYFKGAYSKMFDDKGIVEIVFQSKNKDFVQSLNNFEVTLPNSSRSVLLNDVVDIVKLPAYSQIFKENNERIRSITASIRGTTSSDIYEQLDPTIQSLEKSVSIVIKGEQEENKKVQKEMMEAFLIALILIFIALVWMFDSTVKPLIIISTIPLSVLGVLVGHFLLGMNLTMPSLIGIVGLAGVIVNDGIIMMDFIKNSKSIQEVRNNALLRLRPILLTSITTVLGLFTLMFFASGQALILKPMAVSLGFGVMWATVLNLYYVPLLYCLIYQRKNLDKESV